MKFLFNRFLWTLMNCAIGVFYRYGRRMHSSGLENVPRDKPLLLCSNHPNAFMDAMIVACTVPQQTYFLVRSDVFRKPWHRRLLEFLFLIPIYRRQEGLENLQKNDETFRLCYEHLKEKASIIIFSEGYCVQERRLRKLKKGTARIAFGAEEAADFRLGLTIVPVGVNYTHRPWKFRQPVHVRFGEAFEVRQFEERYRNEKARGINEFTAYLEERMREQLLIVEEKENDQLVADLEEMFLAPWAKAKGLDPGDQKQTYPVSKEIAELVNAAAKTQPERVAGLREKTKIYLDAVKKRGLRDWLLREDTILNMRAGQFFSDTLLFLLAWPLFLAGLLLNALPFFLPHRMASKKVKHMEWHASLNVSFAAFMFLFWYIILWVAAACVFNWWIGLIVLVSLYPLGRFAWWFYVRWKKFNGRRKLLSLVSSNHDAAKELLLQRSEIKQEIEALRG